jgi:excisionase family DNA binding protein
LKNEASSIPEKQETKKFSNIFAETVNPDHLTVKQASEFLNIAEQTIYGYTHRKQIPFYKPHKKLYFLKTELEVMVEAGKTRE